MNFYIFDILNEFIKLIAKIMKFNCAQKIIKWSKLNKIYFYIR